MFASQLSLNVINSARLGSSVVKVDPDLCAWLIDRIRCGFEL
ncbi:hypothetical protein SynMITS9220_00915 [Synechococcus sp. MIT S9220]|nr:hypothetical protein SynMITS9220_00915 [Synechococcus sp. MIT S9220]